MTIQQADDLAMKVFVEVYGSYKNTLYDRFILKVISGWLQFGVYSDNPTVGQLKDEWLDHWTDYRKPAQKQIDIPFFNGSV